MKPPYRDIYIYILVKYIDILTNLLYETRVPHYILSLYSQVRSTTLVLMEHLPKRIFLSQGKKSIDIKEYEISCASDLLVN